MQLSIDVIEQSIFEKGYPKRVFYKHKKPARVYYGPNNTIIGVFPSKIEYFKIVYHSYDEYLLNTRKSLKKTYTRYNLLK